MGWHDVSCHIQDSRSTESPDLIQGWLFFRFDADGPTLTLADRQRFQHLQIERVKGSERKNRIKRSEDVILQ